MEHQVNVVGGRPGDAERPQESGVAALGRGGRMSRQRKSAAVLRLLRGEDLETVSREHGVTAATLTNWHDAFLEFRQTYNTNWLIERHGFLTPAQFRHKQPHTPAIAA